MRGGCRGTDGDVLGVDARVQQSLLPAVQLLLSLAGQLQAPVVLVDVPAKTCSGRVSGGPIGLGHQEPLVRLAR